jgi:rhodanese-related sulfurtransferase
MACLYPLVLPESYQMSLQQIQQVQYRHRLDFLPTIDVAAVAEHIKSGDAVIIDSRHVADYLVAHIPGALNLPTTLGDMEIRTRMDGTPVTAPLIIYCQSMGCDYDEQIAMRLLNIGYQDLTLFVGGWVAWQDYAKTHGLDRKTDVNSGV